MRLPLVTNEKNNTLHTLHKQESYEKLWKALLSVQIIKQNHTSIFESTIVYSNTFIPNKAQLALSISANIVAHGISALLGTSCFVCVS